MHAEATSRCCSSGVRVERLRQQVVCPGRLAHSQIELCEAESLRGIVSRTKPELRCMIGERRGMSCGQFVVAACCYPMPGDGFLAAADFAKDARELRRVVWIVGRGCQRNQPANRGFCVAQFSID